MERWRRHLSPFCVLAVNVPSGRRKRREAELSLAGQLAQVRLRELDNLVGASGENRPRGPEREALGLLALDLRRHCQLLARGVDINERRAVAGERRSECPLDAGRPRRRRGAADQPACAVGRTRISFSVIRRGRVTANATTSAMSSGWMARSLTNCCVASFVSA